jgi:hypothetical protein
MKLTSSNYFTGEANNQFWSVSMFKAFRDCPAAGMAMLKGEYERPTTTALLQGSYVDAHFSGTLNEFLDAHPEVLNKRTGELKADYQKARAAIARAESDPYMMECLSGKPQQILTAEVFGEPWKCKVDFLHEDKIVDLKYMKDMKPIYKDGEYKPFVIAYGYDIQGFIYQKIVEQVTGKRLPFYLAVITKEDPSDIRVIEIPQEILNGAGGLVQHWIQIFAAIKRGEVEADRCEQCAYCRATRKLTGPTSYYDIFE